MSTTLTPADPGLLPGASPQPDLADLLRRLARATATAVRTGVRRAVPVTLDLAEATVLLLWGLTRLLARTTARVIAWFAAEPRRIGVAAAGLGLAVALGAAIGYGTGLLLTEAWRLVSATVFSELG